MANKLNMSLQKERKRVRMRSRIATLILLVVTFQLLSSAAILAFGGEFRDLKEHSYNTLAEKAADCNAYILKEMQDSAAVVGRHADQLGELVKGILKEHGASAADMRTDDELDRVIIDASVSVVSDLLRRSMADDAYLILDTGDLYTGEDGETVKAALYLCAADPAEGEESGPVMVIGFDSAAESAGIERHQSWSEYFAPDPGAGGTFDFYYKTIAASQENGNLTSRELGCWSRFSKISNAVAPSMKYTMPLISDDGVVYGVIGVGIASPTVFAGMPSFGALSETACCILGYAASEGTFEVMAHSGSAYSSLLGSAGKLHIQSGTEVDGVYSFDKITGVDLSGSVQYMEMYDNDSPYLEDQWVLIFVADRSSALHPVLFLEKMLVVSALVSLIVSAVIASLGCSIIIKPLSDLSKNIKAKRKYYDVVRFEPSNIYEIDEITDAITQMQINVHDFSSQVSKMISIADVGLGTYMYDRTDDSVFVGHSLIKILDLDLIQEEDAMLSRQQFMDSIKHPEIRTVIAAGLGMGGGEIRGDHSEEHQINRVGGGTLWLRLGYTYSPNTAICIIQDITDAMMEKNRIEYERDYDILTGLLNRQAYYRRVEELFVNRDELKITAFIMIDLDNLKYVNDTYGHDFGDSYIRTAATVLKEFQEYGGIVSRLSGDEFNICMPGFSSKEEVREIITNVHNKLMQSSCLLADGTRYRVSGSMGVSWYPDDAESRELLMKYADFAMYAIKHSTKGNVAEFDIGTYEADSVLLTGVEELNRVIEERSVRYAFQSIVSAKTGEIYGYEALMRVQSEIFQSPPELLRIAKTGAKLYEIERLTWTRSLADFKTQIDAGNIDKTAHIFINSIANTKPEPEVEAAIENDYPELLDNIVMEILESERSNEDCTVHKAHLIQKWGAQLALDDFGTGYNSEYALLSLRPNIIKIDRSIISGCDVDPDRRMIIENLIKLARAKGVLVLAEGVETEAEMKTVIACGVDLMQGYYLAHPEFEPEPLPPALTETIRNISKQSETD